MADFSCLNGEALVKIMGDPAVSTTSIHLGFDCLCLFSLNLQLCKHNKLGDLFLWKINKINKTLVLPMIGVLQPKEAG